MGRCALAEVTSTVRDVDVLVIATNNAFSNATIDWLKDFTRTHRGPTIRLWDRRRLQKIVEKFPEVAAQAWPDLLDDDERAKLLVAQFYEKGRVFTGIDLEYFWAKSPRTSDHELVLCAAYSEMLQGDLGKRPWITWLDEEHIHYALARALTGLLIAAARHRSLDFELAQRVAAYVLIHAATVGLREFVYTIMENPFAVFEGYEPSKKDADYYSTATGPILSRALSELADICSDDCARLYIDPPMTLSPSDVGERYWRRYRPARESEERSLCLYYWDNPCAVGFDIPGVICPLHVNSLPELNPEIIAVIEKVVKFRSENPDGQFLKYNKMTPEMKKEGKKVLKDFGILFETEESSSAEED